MRPYRSLVGPLGAAALVGLVPVGVLAAGLHFRAVARGELRLAAAADAMVVRCDRLFAAADKVLSELARVHDGDPPSKVLREREYTDPRFREFGVIDPAGRLIRNDVREVDPPIPVLPTDMPDLSRPETQIVGRRRTALMDAESLVLARPTGKGRGALNVLVDPDVFTYLVDDAGLGAGGFVAVAGADGRRLADVPADGAGCGRIGRRPAAGCWWSPRPTGRPSPPTCPGTCC